MALPVWAEVHWKSREAGARLEGRLNGGKSRVAERRHLVLDFEATPGAETLRRLEERGMRIVGYLPETGVVVGVDGAPDLAGLGVTGFDAWQPGDRLSPELARAGRIERREFFVVEFHRDVPEEDRRAVVREAGMEVREHRDLVEGHVLARGTARQARGLAEWDEVSYIFPASGELASGLPLIGCLGGATESGLVGQQTQRVGEGWDGPGLGRADLTYTIQAITGKVGADEAKAEIRRAMEAWTRVVKVRFAAAAGAPGTKNVNILFGAGAHGDPYPFDGAGKVLAHTFYPAPPNPEPVAGDLHFDDAEPWRIGSDIDIYSVALHELGHALGLGHSDVPNAVMYPYYRRATDLTPEDIGAVRLLYAAEETGAAPAPLAATWTGPASGSSTTAAAFAVSGQVTGAAGTPAARWKNEQGGEGAADVAVGGSGFTWMASVPLAMGDKRITVTVTDAAARTAVASAVVRRDAVPVTPPVPPGGPTTPPVPPSTPTTPTTPPIPPTHPTPPTTPTPPELALDVLAPGASAIVTANPTNAYGVISGSTGRPVVRWSSDRGFNGTAVITPMVDGRYRWEANPLSVLPGINVFTVTATDTAGRTSSRTFRVSLQATEEPDDGDTWAPTIKIVSPNTTFLMTTAYSISVRGTANDASGVAEVRWECTCGASGVASGTVQWTIPNIAFAPGTWAVRIYAKDVFGNEAMTSFNVFRYSN